MTYESTIFPFVSVPELGNADDHYICDHVVQVLRNNFDAVIVSDRDWRKRVYLAKGIRIEIEQDFGVEYGHLQGIVLKGPDEKSTLDFKGDLERSLVETPRLVNLEE